MSAAAIAPVAQATSLARNPDAPSAPPSRAACSSPLSPFAPSLNGRKPTRLPRNRLGGPCGKSAEGSYLNTPGAVDIPIGWVDCQGVPDKGQQRVGGAIHHIWHASLSPLLGLDPDNGSEFINHYRMPAASRKHHLHPVQTLLEERQRSRRTEKPAGGPAVGRL